MSSYLDVLTRSPGSSSGASRLLGDVHGAEVEHTGRQGAGTDAPGNGKERAGPTKRKYADAGDMGVAIDSATGLGPGTTQEHLQQAQMHAVQGHGAAYEDPSMADRGARPLGQQSSLQPPHRQPWGRSGGGGSVVEGSSGGGAGTGGQGFAPQPQGYQQRSSGGYVETPSHARSPPSHEVRRSLGVYTT